MTLPDKDGKFGLFGGRFVPETLMNALFDLERNYLEAMNDCSYQNTLANYLTDFVGRPTPLYFAEGLTKLFNGPKIYLKREDLCHGGAHKINNTLGQVLLAKRMKKSRIIAETGAGQHGVATAFACAKLGLKCEVYMGAKDVARQQINVQRMKLLGAKVRPVISGSQTLKDAINETMRNWVIELDSTFYCVGSVVGPHPYPMMVRNFQSIIGKEIKNQILSQEKRLPSALIACVGGGSNAIGAFHEFINDTEVNLIGVEAAGKGLETTKHSAPLNLGTPGSLHGANTYLLQDDFGQIKLSHSIAAGLDYPGVGPELAHLKKSNRMICAFATDKEVISAYNLLCTKEGIIPALESAHAVAYLANIVSDYDKDSILVVNLSGRGDKDIQTVISNGGELDG